MTGPVSHVPHVTVTPDLPALVVGTVGHTRRTPMRRHFTHHVYQWLVDLDSMPRPPLWLRPFAGFRAADHIGDPRRSIKENVVAFCAANDIDVRDHRIVMLANARILGHVFDPLSVFWAIAPDGQLTCVVAEVHNTYGERHAYLLRPDVDGRTGTAKKFYVSPFLTVAGQYDLRFRLEPDVVSTTIVLRQGPDRAEEPEAPEATAATEAVFSATFSGTPHLATSRRLLRLLITNAFMTHRVSLLIRMHGVWLWLRRLPVVARPTHRPQEGTQ